MKIIHLSDLHIGKRLQEHSLIEDQKFILNKILSIIDDERANVVLIAGDVYDKSVPPAEAVRLFDDFLFHLFERSLKVFVLSGNHDSPDRIAFGSRLVDKSGIFLSPVYNGNVTPVSLEDENGVIDIFMLPFIKPAHVRSIFPDKEIDSYTDAVREAVNNMNVNEENRNILMTHQFVTGASRCDSEDISVGGSDNVDVSVFKQFDYVALGHLHSPQNVKFDKVRYCGTPLKYSFSEADQQKSVTVITMHKKGDLEIKTVPLTPMRDLKEIKGKYDEITRKSFYEDTTYKTDYIHVTLTDEDDIPDAVGKLRAIYHNIMKLDYDNTRTRSNSVMSSVEKVEQKTPFELFAEFYEKQNNKELTEVQENYIKSLIEVIWEADNETL